ncbi:MAG: hypothetical protein IH946_08055 [Bacteroidetes bacterium]|nr:hypothetical protein [Bacteroidota bacterium]
MEETKNDILITMFHEGKVYKISKNDPGMDLIFQNLLRPHGARKTGSDLMVTSTGTGELVVMRNGEETRYDFTSLAGKPDYLMELEWLQNSAVINNLIVTIDSNRTSFVILDLLAEKYSMVPYDDNWAVQDLIPGKLSVEQERLLSRL